MTSIGACGEVNDAEKDREVWTRSRRQVSQWLILYREAWSWREESNLQPAVYKSVYRGLLKSLTTWAIPLSFLHNSLSAFCFSLPYSASLQTHLSGFLTPI